MENQTALLIAWSFGIAASGYLLFAAYLFSLGKEWRQGNRTRAMLAAILLSSCWAGLGALFALTGNALLLLSSTLADLLRYGSWYVFLILLLSLDKPAEQTPQLTTPGSFLPAGQQSLAD